jgi:hypothetical protein
MRKEPQEKGYSRLLLDFVVEYGKAQVIKLSALCANAEMPELHICSAPMTEEGKRFVLKCEQQIREFAIDYRIEVV